MKSKKIRVAFFGASVTAQKNGYVDYFHKLNPDLCVKKYGFGAMNLNEAGIIYIDDVLRFYPNICFLDWFTCSYFNEDGFIERYISTIVGKLHNIKCRAILLFLPFKDDERRAVWYYEMESLCKKNNIEYLRLDSLLSNESLDKLLRDYIHTTNYGAQVYAETLTKYLISSKFGKDISLDKYDNSFSQIKNIRIRRGGCKFLLEANNCHIIGLNIKTGKFSGIVSLNINNNSIHKENSWDIWSYFIRDKFILRGYDLNGKYSLEATDEVFDITQCKKELDWQKYKKKIVINDVFYVGESLRISGGLYFSWFVTKMIAKLDAIKHILGLQ